MKKDRILVVRFSSLGDIILLTPLFREIKKVFPDSSVDFLTSTAFADICQNNPHIDEIIALDRKKGNSELSRVVDLCQNKQYDLILDAHQSLRSRFLLWRWFGAFLPFKKNIVRINKRSFKRNLLLITGINIMKNSLSQREEYCSLIKDFTGPLLIETKTELFPGEKEQKRVKELIQKKQLNGKKVVALGVGASFPGKCWPKENFLTLTRLLQDKGFSVIFLGGKEDQEPGWILNQCTEKPVNLAGELSFLETAEVLKYCQLVISNDSAVVHFGEAMGIPALAVFGPTVREFGYAPFLEQSKIVEVDLDCRPCSRNGKGKCRKKVKRECLKLVSVEMVMADVKEVLKI